MAGVRSELDSQLRELVQSVLEMGSFVEAMLRDAMRALETQDAALAREVRRRDQHANDFDASIEEAAIRLLALQCPLARDLRTVASGLKVVTDLERIGDYASDIAKVAMWLAEEPYFVPLEDIPRMGQIAVGMVHDGLSTYVSRHIVFGKQVRDRDREMDRTYKRVHGQILDWMRREPATIFQAMNLLLVARYLERIGDHAKNIIERVAYMETGSRWPWRSPEWKQAHGASTAVDDDLDQEDGADLEP